ncbi:hypothetical protein GCM10023238_01900 [Streptomyces heliomycini]
MLSWEATLRALATPGTPRACCCRSRVPRRPGTHGPVRRPQAGAVHLDRIAVPTQIFHGPDDTVAPWRSSAASPPDHPNTITLHTVRGASHGAMWNADPQTYEEALRRFPHPLM